MLQGRYISKSNVLIPGNAKRYWSAKESGLGILAAVSTPGTIRKVKARTGILLKYRFAHRSFQVLCETWNTEIACPHCPHYFLTGITPSMTMEIAGVSSVLIMRKPASRSPFPWNPRTKSREYCNWDITYDHVGVSKVYISSCKHPDRLDHWLFFLVS